MSERIWTNTLFRLVITWVNLIALLCILTYHSYLSCYLQKDLKGSPIKIFKFISFKHLSFAVIIAGVLPALGQAIMYTPHLLLPDAICTFSAQFGIVSSAIVKLALHLFVAVRSQVPRGSTNIWYGIGVALTLSDVLYIIYVVSGIPTIQSVQNGVLCKVTHVSLPVYIWFAMNDFVIGTYCLLAFIVPLRKYVRLETEEADVTGSELQDITKKVMIYSAIALLSTMIFTVISSVVNESGAVLFPIDNTINGLCVALQFSNRSKRTHCCGLCGESADATMSTMSEIDIQSVDTTMKVVKRTSRNNVEMIIHGVATNKVEKKAGLSRPGMEKNVSLSLSLVDNDTQDIASDL